MRATLGSDLVAIITAQVVKTLIITALSHFTDKNKSTVLVIFVCVFDALCCTTCSFPSELYFFVCNVLHEFCALRKSDEQG
jgi:hypothetical protein